MNLIGYSNSARSLQENFKSNRETFDLYDAFGFRF